MVMDLRMHAPISAAYDWQGGLVWLRMEDGAAMDEALRTNSPTASGRVTLVQEGEGVAPGFLIYMPVVDGEGVRTKVRGFIYSPFNAKVFLDSALQLEQHTGMGVKLYRRGLWCRGRL